MNKAAQHSRKDSAESNDVKSQNVVPIRAEDNDPLAHFKVEGEAAAPPGRPARARRGISRKALTGIGAAVVLAGLATAAVVYARQRARTPSPGSPPVLTERARLSSRPEGAAVIVDGIANGVTPIELALALGPHDVLLRNDAGERHLTVIVEKGTVVSENVDMPAPVTSGQLDVTSDPAGARVMVDSTAAGRTPLKVKSLTPGRHTVVVSDGTTSVNRAVDVTAGATLSMFISLASQPANGLTGMVAFDSPLELRLLEDGHLLGLSNGAPLVLSPGRHRLDLINDALEMKLSRTVTIDAGKTARVAVAAPNGTLNVNATPWAEVSVDGQSIGTTPLGNVPVAVGTHDMVWRHPQLGEKRRTVVVGAQTPVRLTMDMSR
jgi:eukaryotic-like serine/threonine-protein kinase